jgi:nitroimidazol reductase NimA-like FMN-containing flavoprotein (pyridoxamine 5'-phosphate oxidase superfamily)
VVHPVTAPPPTAPAGDQPAPGSTPRTKGRRLNHNEVRDRAALHAVLDAGTVAHVAVVDGSGQPFVLAVAYARDGESVVFHGSTGSRLFRTLAAGAPTCFTVTLLDGLVLARSAFESSMNYRSVMVLGTCTSLTGDAKADALRTITEHLLPGRWEHARPMLRKERAATIVLSLPLDECSVKIRTGGPTDETDDDIALPIWAGHIPIRTVYDDPVVAADMVHDLPVPEHVRDLTGGSR